MPDPIRLVVGVDPGATGAYACLTDAGELLWIEDAPSPYTGYMVASIFLNDLISYVVVERAQARPKERAGAAFNYGTGYGIILGVLGAWAAFGECVGVIDAPSFETVPPATWKKTLGLTGKDKAAARAMAQATWPDKAHMFTRVKDHGRAEAALIGLWWCRTRTGVTA
jgi:crossover junction endodeoxyribonuclease RuvC